MSAQMKAAREVALIEDELAHYPPEVAERAKNYARTTPLTWRQAIAKAIREYRPA